MPKDSSKGDRREVARRPPPVIGSAAMMAEAQGMDCWVGGPVQANMSSYHSKTVSATPPRSGGAANRIPTEIALQISKHLNVRDLARAAVAWRPVYHASHAFPEFIRTECARFGLVANHMRTWPSQLLAQVRDRIEQYNFAWSTLQYSGGQFFSIPQTSDETPWAGSLGWKSGKRFMGESNGYVYDVGSWDAGPQVCARVRLYQAPSFRTGEINLKCTQIDVALRSHYVKAVSVDPVGQVVAILEYNNNEGANPHSRIPYLHVYDLKGKHVGTARLMVGFQMSSEVYHMELHGEMLCIVANYRYGKDMISEMLIQNWCGAQRYVSISRCDHATPFVTGFQFITEDMYITTEKSKLEARDQILSQVVRVGSIRTNTQRIVNFADIYGKGWTPNGISLIRNISPHQPVSGTFSSDPSKRLFGIRYDYLNFKNILESNACLFGRTTVESWLGISTLEEVEPLHWLTVPLLNDAWPTKPRIWDPTNREGVALIGRRLFWGEIFPDAVWGLGVLDYNPGAGIHIEKRKETRGKQWESFTCLFCSDPYPVAFTATTRISNVKRIIPTEDGILIKQDDPNAPTFMALLM
ncbi:hypothetical protein DFH09DRAFT_1139876 [Mycena vulgaris]|nr:hypothetical protein DFH09DRAFT_1139876 [Mycena vulgaris]